MMKKTPEEFYKEILDLPYEEFEEKLLAGILDVLPISEIQKLINALPNEEISIKLSEKIIESRNNKIETVIKK